MKKPPVIPKNIDYSPSSPLKKDGLEVGRLYLSFWVSAYFQGRTVKLRECILGTSM